MMTAAEQADAARYFAKHRASYDEATMNGRRVEVLEWREPGTGVHSIRYVAIGGVLSVSGDLGDAIYITGADSLKWWARCDTHYFAGKCAASEDGRGYRHWDEVAAEERFREEIARMRDDGETIDDDLVDDALSAINGGEWEWVFWLREQGSDLFGDDWWDFAPRFGKVIAPRCALHLLGLQLAIQQLAEASA